MAWSNREAHFVMNAHTRWRDKADDADCIGWARQLFDATAPFATGSVYVNFMPDDEKGRVEKAYGKNYRRLAEIKRRYDPDNLFRMNQNIRPIPKAVAGAADAGRKASEAVAMGRRALHRSPPARVRGKSLRWPMQGERPCSRSSL